MRIRQSATPSIVSRIVSKATTKASPASTIIGRVAPKIALPRYDDPTYLPPVHFFAESDVAAGAEATMRADAISNRTGQPIEIHEIRFAGWSFKQAALSRSDAGGYMRVRLTVNGKPITNGFVPIWLLGKTEMPGSNVSPATANQAKGHYVWRLAKPWHLPSKANVECQFQHTGAVRYAIRAQIGLAGRYVRNRATVTSIPYAAAYISKPFAYTAADGSGHDYDESSERDLVNITGRKLHVDRIIGRVGTARAQGSTAIAFFEDRDNIGWCRNTQFRILTSTNLPILRDYTPPREVFLETHAIETSFDLAPNDFLRVGVRNDDGPVMAAPYTTYMAQANVSIIGSREEAI